MGSPAEVIPTLEYLINNIGFLDLVAVVSQPAKKVGRGKKLTNPPVAIFAESKGIPLYQPEKASTPEFLQNLKSLEPDLVITAAYGQILSDDFLKIPKRGTINIHPSKLPIYRGATPVQAALLNGDTETAVTILFTVKKMDAGNIILQEKFKINPEDTSRELLPRLFAASGPLLEKAVLKLRDKSYEGTPQSESEKVECRKIKKEDGLLDFHNRAEDIINTYRGLTPWPGVYSFLSQQRISFDNMIQMETSNMKPGFFHYDKTNKMVIVGTLSEDIGIKNLKPAGKKLLDAPSFWNGLRNKENLSFDEVN